MVSLPRDQIFHKRDSGKIFSGCFGSLLRSPANFFLFYFSQYGPGSDCFPPSLPRCFSQHGLCENPILVTSRVRPPCPGLSILLFFFIGHILRPFFPRCLLFFHSHNSPPHILPSGFPTCKAFFRPPNVSSVFSFPSLESLPAFSQ